MAVLDYKHKRVVVSGCFSGMGEATARLLVELGAEVHGIDYKRTQLQLASFTQVDLRDPEAIDAAAESIGGHIDALFNCAGLPQTAAPLDVMKVNYLGTRRLTEQLVPYMSKGSAVASIASTAGMGWSRRLPTLMELIKLENYQAALEWCENHSDIVREGYGFSKECIIVWTMLASSQLIQSKGIRINCILPGPTQTPMMGQFESATPVEVIDAVTQPINRRSLPEEQAGPLIFLNSDAASYVNGVPFAVDGGFISAVTTGQVDMSTLGGLSSQS